MVFEQTFISYHICYHICYHMFHPDKDFRFIVLDTLTEEGKSISSLYKDLNKKGLKINRLLLTGYLRALTDLKIVREKIVPPAKIYIPIKGKEQDFYQMIGEKARELFPGEGADHVLLFSLNRMFRRAVFIEELARCGIEGNIPGTQATPEQRLEAKKVLVRSGFKVPDSSRAYVLEDVKLEKEYSVLLETIVLTSQDAFDLVKETKQTKLTL
jgi:hypothetical protein